MTEEQAIQLASNPEKIIDPSQCNLVISYLGGYISVLVEDEFEKRLVSSQKKVKLLNEKDKTNAVAKAEWEISEEYLKWQEVVRELRKMRALKSDLKDRFQVITNQRY